jgi:branched-chain amino acid transport system ATP-binding protein
VTTALEAQAVSVHFGGNAALVDVSVTADSGCVTGLIGPNGAGKTTLFNIIGGLLRPSSGRILLDGRDVTNQPTHARARAGLARTFQRLELFGVLTAHANVRVAADLARRRGAHRDRSADDVAAAFLERVGLTDVSDVRADQLPTGQARLVELARALATAPSVLLLDEPASGLDEGETAAFGRLLRELAADGMAVLLVEHDVPLVLSTCDTVHVLDVGRLLATGTPDEIRADTRVHDAYLGAVTV